jgi:hypothetical protein
MAISVLETSAPARSMRPRPTARFSSERDPTASLATCTV